MGKKAKGINAAKKLMKRRRASKWLAEKEI